MWCAFSLTGFLDLRQIDVGMALPQLNQTKYALEIQGFQAFCPCGLEFNRTFVSFIESDEANL